MPFCELAQAWHTLYEVKGGVGDAATRIVRMFLTILLHVLELPITKRRTRISC